MTSREEYRESAKQGKKDTCILSQIDLDTDRGEVRWNWRSYS